MNSGIRLTITRKEWWLDVLKYNARQVVFYGRVSTDHEAQLSALENQIQWYEKIDVVEGDILCIDKNGGITRSEFEPKNYRSKYASWYDYEDSSYYNIHEEMLLEMCSAFGASEDDVLLLLDYGYSAMEVEEMLMDTDLLHEALREVKYMCGESLYESCYGGVL